MLRDGSVFVLSTQKKCDFLEKIAHSENTKFKITLLIRNKSDGNAENYDKLWKQILSSRVQGDQRKVGLLAKERSKNEGASIVSGFDSKLQKWASDEPTEFVDVASGVAWSMAVKDADELVLLRKSSVLSNKILKHGCVKKMEEVIDSHETISHEGLSNYVEEILEDPTKLEMIKNVPKDDVQSCYFPIVQSGGEYDLKVSAQSTSAMLSNDVITVSLGARYRYYCSNVARTFFVDPPKKVSETYEVLLELQEACLEAMKPGLPLKGVYKAAQKFLQDRNGFEYLAEKLPKNLGFATGLEFRESSLILSSKNTASFKQGMVFCLSLGFQNLELSAPDLTDTPDKSPVKKLSTFALVLADTVCISNDSADVMTKMSKHLTDVAYQIHAGNEDESEDGDDDDSGDDDSVEAPDAPEGDEDYARKVEKNDRGVRSSSRLAKDQVQLQENADGIAEREKKQIKLMDRRNEERLRELARANHEKGSDDEKDQAEELQAYKRTRDYPDNVLPNQVKVDMANQCVLLPVCGNSIPFHISTIKNVVMPEGDSATLLRINFYTAGMAVGKDAPANMVKLVQKYAPYASFVREMTFRSLDGHNLTLAFRQISELRKRARQKEIREQEEADLVEQEKLVRTRNERVPRLADLTMRPVLAKRKTQGNLEAHTNGLRFRSGRDEVVDVMYNNIKYAIYQPCEREIMVLIHFHLKNPIMIGKKKHKDIQFFTEIIEASQAVDNRRNGYDPDEMDDEQRERQLRKRLNHAFKEFCKKVDAVAKKNGYELEFDIPYRDLGFTGTPHKEMVTIMPTLNCLVNLTETPFFVVNLDEVDHVHFERVTFMSSAFDVVLVNKDFNKPPWRVDMIPNADKDAIQEWLTDMEITYTEGPMNLNWKSIMGTVKEDERFYMNTEEDEITEKEAGWEFLRMFGREDGEENDEEDDDSAFSEKKDDSGAASEESEDDFDSGVDEDDEDDFDADEDLEEQGLDWDDMEAEAAAEDKRRRHRDEDDEDGGGKRRRR